MNTSHDTVDHPKRVRSYRGDTDRGAGNPPALLAIPTKVCRRSSTARRPVPMCAITHWTYLSPWPRRSRSRMATSAPLCSSPTACCSAPGWGNCSSPPVDEADPGLVDQFTDLLARAYLHAESDGVKDLLRSRGLIRPRG